MPFASRVAPGCGCNVRWKALCQKTSSCVSEKHDLHRPAFDALTESLIGVHHWDDPGPVGFVPSFQPGVSGTMLLLPWQATVLAPASGAVWEAMKTTPPESPWLAQGAPPASKDIPAEVMGWFDAMKEAADKDDGAEALRMHERVMA
jgi:hypothetical protein